MKYSHILRTTGEAVFGSKSNFGEFLATAQPPKSEMVQWRWVRTRS